MLLRKPKTGTACRAPTRKEQIATARIEKWMEKKKALKPVMASGPSFDFIPATTYVPTQLPVQYHRPGEA